MKLEFRRLLDRLSGPQHNPQEKEVLARLAEPLKTDKQLKRLSSVARDSSDTYQFAVLGDAEPGRFWFARAFFNIPGVFRRQIQDIQRRPVDFTIQLGDMVSRGIAQNYLRFIHDLSTVQINKPYLTVIGNHDRRSPHRRSDSELYRLCFGWTNYFFEHGGVRFVVVDTSAHYLTPRQLKWLNLVLKTNRRKVVFTHIPPATLRHWTDFSGTRGVGGFRKGSEEFTEIMSRHSVDRVYVGHIHGFGVQDCRGVRYVLSGGGGSPLFPSDVRDRFHHYIIATVTADGIKERVCSFDDREFEIPNGKVLISR